MLVLSIILSNCNDKDLDQTKPDPVLNNSIVPDDYVIDIPDALSFDVSLAGGRVLQDNTIAGEDIYESLRGFIWVGESSVEILVELFNNIFNAEVENLISFSVTSDDDGRQKDFLINQNSTFEQVDFRYDLTMTDADGSLAARILWSLDPVEIVAILSPYHINRNEDASLENAVLRIDYSEDDDDYNETMQVAISGLPEAADDLNNLKMFIGKTDNLLDIYGNSNHPNLTIIDSTFTGGRNYAFVARANEEAEIGVAAIGLPPSAVDTNEDIIDDFSVFNVLESELNAVGITDQALIDQILANAIAPAYFDNDGFISSGPNIPANLPFTEDFIDLSELTPFVPREIRDLSVSFSD